MKTWHLAAVALLTFGCDNQTAQKESAGTQPTGPGKVRPDLRLVPKGAVFSADGKLLLTSYAVESWPIRSYKARSLVLWEVETGKKRWAADDTENLEPLGFLPDGKSALVRGYNSLQVWDLAQGRRESNFPQTPNEQIGRVSLSHSGKLALVAVNPKNGVGRTHLDLWDTTLRKPLRRFGEFKSHFDRLLFSPDDKTAISTSFGSTKEPPSIVVWEISSGKMMQSLPPERYIGTPAGFLPGGQRVFCGCRRTEAEEPQIAIGEVSTGKELFRVQVPRDARGDLGPDTFAPDKEHFLLFGANRVSYLDWPKGKLVWSRTFNEPMGLFFLQSVALSPDGTLAFTGHGSTGLAGGTHPGIRLTLWDVQKGEVVRELPDPRWTKESD
jgi:WD40 repeat protein